jgi:hypothetical protein
MLPGTSAALVISPTSGVSTASGIFPLLALFPPLLPRLLVLLALLAVLLALLPALLALFLALLPVPGPVLVPAMAALSIALASTAPAWLVASVSPAAHESLLVLSIASHDSVSCTRSGTGVTSHSFWITEAG